MKRHKHDKKRERRINSNPPFDSEEASSRLRSAKKAKIRPNKPSSLRENMYLSELCELFKIAPDEWEAIIVTDGSGTTWTNEFGWAAILVSNDSLIRVPFYGGGSHGSNNVAELMAVLHPLLFLTANDAAKSALPTGFRVHIFSDSEYVVAGINAGRLYPTKRNTEIWSAIHAVRRQGFFLIAHHIPRDTLGLNKIAHELANIGRKAMQPALGQLEQDYHVINPA